MFGKGETGIDEIGKSEIGLEEMDTDEIGIEEIRLDFRVSLAGRSTLLPFVCSA